MSDRELLEMAAKAAGISIDPIDAMHDPSEWVCWNPLTDDGDALRLAVRLHLTLKIEPHECEVFNAWGECLASEPIFGASAFVKASEATDPYAATRRAIVRTAAEIGKAMP